MGIGSWSRPDSPLCVSCWLLIAFWPQGCYEHKLLLASQLDSDWSGDRLQKRAKHSDAVMTGILVTRFKMGQIDVRDLAEMAADKSRAERCSAAKKVLEAIIDS